MNLCCQKLCFLSESVLYKNKGFVFLFEVCSGVFVLFVSKLVAFYFFTLLGLLPALSLKSVPSPGLLAVSPLASHHRPVPGLLRAREY